MQKITDSAKIRVVWNDKPENYTRESKNKIKSFFSKKYSIPATVIDVSFRAVKPDINGNFIEIEDAVIDNIMDVEYQRSLFKEWLKREEIEIDFDKILRLDNKINSILSQEQELDYRHRKWSIKSLKVNNLLSFGDNNIVDFNLLKGLNVITSAPENQGGKCVKANTKIKIQYDPNKIIKKLGFLPDELISLKNNASLFMHMKKEIEIGKLNEIYKKYGDLGFQVETPYGYYDITWCGITEKNADVYRCELEDGKFIEGADYHRLKKENNEFVPLKNIEINTPIQTINGISKVRSIKLLDEKDTLYDIQVDKVHQYYTNGIVSHNTVFSVDFLMFLLFGLTTKTDRQEEIFNTFRDVNEVSITGELSIDGNDYIIERKLKRAKKKAGGWTVKSTVDFYIPLSNGERQNLNEEDSIETTKKILKSIGSESDFLLTVLATANNLEDLINTKPTERGKLFTKFTGLEILEIKERLAKEDFSKFSKTMKSSEYNLEDLNSEIKKHIKLINDFKENEKRYLNRLDEIKTEIDKTTNDKDNITAKKQEIDNDILKLSPESVKEEINENIKKGVNLKNSIEELNAKIKGFGVIDYDEKRHSELKAKERTVHDNILSLTYEINKNQNLILDLKNKEKCPTCNRKLDGINNETEINKLIEINNQLQSKIEKQKIIHNKINKLIEKEDINKSNQTEKDKTELLKDKNEFEIEKIRSEIINLKRKLKKYKENKEIIEKNKEIDTNIIFYNTKLKSLENEKEELIAKIENCRCDIKLNENHINEKNKIILMIKKEEKIQKIYQIYISMLGKNGISKLILRTILPIINCELNRLIEDVCDFELEVIINDKNELDFLIIKDGVVKQLKSGSGFERTIAAISLRIVLGRASILPKPNFIVFDEVFGKIANKNLEYVKLLFDKIKELYDIVFIITHNPLIQDWGDNIILIKKENNISSFSLN